MRGSWIVLLASLVVTAACVDATRVTMPAPFRRDTADLPHLGVGEQTLAELRQQRERWRNARLTRYRVAQQVLCFCLPRGVRALEVTGETVTRAWDRGTAREVGPDAIDQTVDQLLDRAIAVAERGGLVLGVFDPAYGYPLDLWLDPELSFADDEVEYRLATLTPF